MNSFIVPQLWQLLCQCELNFLPTHTHTEEQKDVNNSSGLPLIEYQVLLQSVHAFFEIIFVQH
jgi:hypothetical protein